MARLVTPYICAIAPMQSRCTPIHFHMHIKFILVSFSILGLIGCKPIPNNEVFEAYSEIKIPGTVHVTRDTVMENVQDFWKTLEFTIDQDSKRELINSVLRSKFINDKIYNDSTLVRPETLKKVDDKEGIWYRAK